ncbi:MAG: class I SAM-dependent methyltransferase [Gammaproteobacteria bacterium]
MSRQITPHRACPCCERRSAKFILEWQFEEWGTRLVIGKCTECGMVYATNSNEVDMSNEKYVHWRPDSDTDHLIPKKIRFDHALMKHLKPRLKPDAWILDYGAGYCGFLRVARDEGFNVEGVNPCLYLAEWAGRNLGITVYPTFGRTVTIERRYDLIVSQQTLEHLIDPYADLIKMLSLLKSGGLAYIDVPNWWTVKRLMAGYACLRNASHYNYFTPRTLAMLCRKAGFEVVEWAPAIGSTTARAALKRMINPLGVGGCSVLLQKAVA